MYNITNRHNIAWDDERSRLEATQYLIRAALAYLPERMCTKNAIALLIATGMQESRFVYTRQINGPARGYWQFESGGGLIGIMSHVSSKDHLKNVTKRFDLPWDRTTLFKRIEEDRLFAAICARLLYFTDRMEIPAATYENEQEAWVYYIRNWRPGKPRRSSWHRFWRMACDVVNGKL